MIQVQCISCQRSYDVDERRIPLSGLRMRCPNCNTSFRVMPSGKALPLATAPAEPPKGAFQGVSVKPPPAPSARHSDLPTPKLQDVVDFPATIDFPAAKPIAKHPYSKPAPPQIPPTIRPVGAAPNTQASAWPKKQGEIVDLPTLGGGVVDLPQTRGVTDFPAAKRADIQKPLGGTDRPKPQAADLPRLKGIADFPGIKAKSAAPADVSAAWGEIELEPMQPSVPASKQRTPYDDYEAPVSSPFEDLDLPMASTKVAQGSKDLAALISPNPDVEEEPTTAFEAENLSLVSLPPTPFTSIAPPGDIDLESADDMQLVSIAPPPDPVALDDLEPLTTSMDTSAGGTGFGELDFGGDLNMDQPVAADIAPAPESIALETNEAPAIDVPSSPLEKNDAKIELEEPKKSPEAGIAGLTAAQGAGKVVRERPVRVPIWKQLRVVIPTVLVLGILIAGTSLGTTQYGLFGMYYLERYSPAAKNSSELDAQIAAADKQASQDTFGDAKAALAMLAEARTKHGLNRKLLAQSLLQESLFQLRFGNDAHSDSRQAGILQRLSKRQMKAPGIDLALAAYWLENRKIDKASEFLAKAKLDDGESALTSLIEGQLALRRAKPEEAKRAFTRATTLKTAGARALWGLAQSFVLGSPDPDAAELAVEAVLAASPLHASARVAKAQIVREAQNDDEAMRLASEVAGLVAIEGGKKIRASRAERSSAWTLIAQIYEARGKWGEAQKAYESALEANPQSGWALVGAGRALLREKKYADAQARFEAVLTRNEAAAGLETTHIRPTEAAKLGAAQAMFWQGQVQQAAAGFGDLAAKHPTDPELLLWLGRAETETKDYKTAETHLRNALKLAPHSFECYLGLTRLLLRTNRAREATEVLQEARKNVDETSEMRQLLGDFELQQNRFEAAESEFRRSLEMEPTNEAALFGLGVTLRKSDKLDEASNTLNTLAQKNPQYPGLEVERGILYEQQGRAGDAVVSYEAAIKERPDDQSLRLRLGAAQVSAGRFDNARKTLEDVLQKQPASGDAEYFLGRIELEQNNLAAAEEHLKRAVDLDGNRSEFHAYLGWALFEKGSLSGALDQVGRALSQDEKNAEAYWVRGRASIRTGAVQDGLSDLEQALKLNPRRYEIYASMGEAYDQLRKLSHSIEAYKKAIEHNPNRGEWWYGRGRVELELGSLKDASESLGKAVALGASKDPLPYWVPDALRLQGEVLERTGKNDEAIAVLKRYLELAPAGSPNIDEVRKHLHELQPKE